LFESHDMMSCVEYEMTLHAFEVLRSEFTRFGHTPRRISKAYSIKHIGITILYSIPLSLPHTITYTPSLLFLLLWELLIFVIFLQTFQISNHFLFLRILLILNQYWQYNLRRWGSRKKYSRKYD